jgi:N-acetylglucosamine kinase-like BadF-type ATPase
MLPAIASGITADASFANSSQAAPESGMIAIIGSGLIFVSLVAGSTRKRKGTGSESSQKE